MRYIFILVSSLLLLLASCEEQDFTEKNKGGEQIDTSKTDTTQINIDSTFVSVKQAQLYYKTGKNTILNVRGYIVGVVRGISISKASFTSPFDVASNLLIADTIQEANPENCIPVQLLINSKLRKNLNLVDNPHNFHKRIVITAPMEAYFRVCGIKQILCYKLQEDNK